MNATAALLRAARTITNQAVALASLDGDAVTAGEAERALRVLAQAEDAAIMGAAQRNQQQVA